MALQTFDASTVQATGSFLVGELEKLDPMVHDPLVDYTWGRDIDLREDITIGDETSSFTNSGFAAAGGVATQGKNWIGKDSTAIAGVALEISKTSNPVSLWGMEIGYTIPELMSAQQLGRPIDAQKLRGLQLKWNMDIDEQVYIGDKQLRAVGLLNSTAVGTTMNVANGASGTSTWATKTPTEIIKDVNELLNAVWAASAWAVVPNRLLLPPAQYSYIQSTPFSTVGPVSILEYLRINNLSNSISNRPLEIYPIKWAAGRGVGGKDRMTAYNKDPLRVRFPLVPLQRTPLEYRGIYHLTTYFGRLGVIESPYPTTIGYADGI